MAILLLPNLIASKGGPSTFQKFLIQEAQSTGHSFTFNSNSEISACIVINGTRHVFSLLALKFARKRILLRLGSRYRSNLISHPDLISTLRYFPRLLSIFFSCLISDVIIFQSYTVKKEWLRSFPLLFRKKTRVIYNPAPHLPGGRYTRSNLLSDIYYDSFNLITVEGTHPPLNYSLPYRIHNHFLDRYPTAKLHVFGDIPHPWPESLLSENTIIYGAIPLGKIATIVKSLERPIYILSDNYPCGCPNSLIEMLFIGLPAICYSNTPGQELLELVDGGFCIPSDDDKLQKGRIHNLDHAESILQQLLVNYEFYSSNACKINLKLDPRVIFSGYLDALYG